MPPRSPLTRHVALLLSGILFWNPLLSAAMGQIVLAPSANEYHHEYLRESKKSGRHDVEDRVGQQGADSKASGAQR
jgi:hypothetical protein